jgi:tRNA-dihydrouridine synthase B
MNKKINKKNNFWLSIGKPILALAPMAGITDSAFRELCRKQGANVVYTEMVSADGLHYDSQKTLELLKFSKKEKPIVVQLFGKDPEKFIKASQIVTKLGFDGIDINFGCPARKVAGHGGGVTLMRDLDLCYNIIKNICDNTPLPVSIKIRSSINKKDSSGKVIGKVTALDLVKKIKDLAITTIMIHGRTYEKPFIGEIDYEMVKKVKEEFSGLVLANGNLTDPEIAQKTLELTKTDGLGLARGLYGRPWLFREIKEYLKKGKSKEITWKDIKKIALDHAKLNFKSKGDYGIIEMRKHLIFYSKGQKQAKEMRKDLVQVESIKDIAKIFKKY